MKQNTKDLTCTIISQEHKDISKRRILEELEKALNGFTDCDTISEISLKAIVRIEQKTQ